MPKRFIVRGCPWFPIDAPLSLVPSSRLPVRAPLNIVRPGWSNDDEADLNPING